MKTASDHLQLTYCHDLVQCSLLFSGHGDTMLVVTLLSASQVDTQILGVNRKSSIICQQNAGNFQKRLTEG